MLRNLAICATDRKCEAGLISKSTDHDQHNPSLYVCDNYQTTLP